MKKTHSQKGFTLFVALIVSSIMLSVGFSIGNIVLKQLLLSSSGKESQMAFFAADSGAECALYWDRKDGAGLSTIDGAFSTSTTAEAIQDSVKCGHGLDGEGKIDGVQYSTETVSGNTLATTTFYVDFSDPNTTYKACAKVTVVKRDPFTIIESRGYNSALIGGACDITNPRTVERGLRLNY